MITGFKGRTLESRTKVEPATVNRIGVQRTGLDVTAWSGYMRISTLRTIAAGSTTTVLNTDATAGSDSVRVKPGDVIVITGLDYTYGEAATVLSATDAGVLTLAQPLSAAPGVGMGFYIFRPSPILVDSTGALILSSVTPASVNVAQMGGIAVQAQPDGLVQLANVLPTGVYDTNNGQWIALFLDVNGRLAVSLAANQSVNVAQINGVTPLMGAGNTGTGSHRVTIASDQATLPILNKAPASSELTSYRNLALGNTGVSIKGSAGVVCRWHITNTSTVDFCFIKWYSKASAASSSDTPVETWPLAPGASANGESILGIAFSAGISARATKLGTDGDTTAPTGSVYFNIGYK